MAERAAALLLHRHHAALEEVHFAADGRFAEDDVLLKKELRAEALGERGDDVLVAAAEHWDVP